MSDEKNQQDPSLRESEEDSAEYTSEREDAAMDKFQRQRELDKVQFQFLGVPEPEVEIPDPSERPIDTEVMREDEVRALETQNYIASDEYEPKGFEDFKGEVFDSPDINPEAKEFQLPATDAPDEFVGPAAADEAAATGVNPRSKATASDPEGLAQPSDDVAPVSENAEPVSKSSPSNRPRSIEKVLDD